MKEELVPILHTCKSNWYKFFTPKKYTGHRCDEYLPILYTSEIINEFFTCVSNWYQLFTYKRNWYQFFTCKRNWYLFFTHVKVIGTNSSHPKNTQVTGVTNTYQFFTRQKLSTREIWAQSLDPKIYRNWPYVNFTFGKCNVLIPIFFMDVKFTKWKIYGSTQPFIVNFYAGLYNFCRNFLVGWDKDVKA